MSLAYDEMRRMLKGPSAKVRSNQEVFVGGFTRKDSTFFFYSLINSVIGPDFLVLDFGAGRGSQEETPSPYKRTLLRLKGRVKRVVGADVDDAVLQNPMLDEAVVFRPGDRLPFENNSFDLIFSDWVLEHIDDPAAFSAEVDRLLKPGGWFFARTPNRFGLIAIGSSIVPEFLHKWLLRRLQPNRESHDIFPTRYRINTLPAVRRWFPSNKWDNFSINFDTEIGYFDKFSILFGISEFIARFLPSFMRPVLLISLRKL